MNTPSRARLGTATVAAFLVALLVLFRTSVDGERLTAIPVDNFTIGSVVLISGETREGVTQLMINLVAAKETVFHFNPRFLKQKVYRNAKLNNTWGVEECDGDFPFSESSNFTIIIVHQSEGFRVFVDQRPKFFFAHRRLTNAVDHVYVDGNADEVTVFEVGVY
uniref:Galectin n=1 Tax=Trichuris muris TaxID=70415 RepID=A0A5S6QUW9_TRIMR